jgi:spermidine synthase
VAKRSKRQRGRTRLKDAVPPPGPASDRDASQPSEPSPSQGAAHAGGDSEPSRSPTSLRLGAALFLLSGAGVLIVETTWLRWLREGLGATAPAVSATLVAFFCGQLIGALAGGRLAHRARRPLRSYAALELAACLACLAAPLLLHALGAALDGQTDALRRSGGLGAARYAVALLATVPAAACFGATFPVLAQACVGAPGGLGLRGSLLYAANTLGAALGAGLATFWLPVLLGVHGSYRIGIACLALAGVGALLGARRADARAGARDGDTDGRPDESDGDTDGRPRPLTDTTSPAAQGATPARLSRGLVALAALSGFSALAGQVLITQAFARVLNQSSLAFGTVLVTNLLALAGGAALVAALVAGGRTSPRSVLAGALVTAALGLAAFPAVFVGASDGLAYLGSDAPWPGYLWSAFRLSAGVAGPTLLAGATVFPAVLACAGREAAPGSAPGGLVARLLAANTVGAIAGAWVGPYLLLPIAGLWLALALLGAALAVGAVALPRNEGRPTLVRDLLLGLGWLIVLTRGNPLTLPPLRIEAGDRLLFLDQGPAALVAVIERNGERFIQTDNHYALGGSADAVHQERQGHLPLLLHPAARSVAFLGSATGSSAGAALSHPVERLVLVEIVPAVTEAARLFFAAETGGVYDDPRTEVVVDDARNFLRAGDERFDAIIADLFVPWRAGSAGLYSREHFQAARKRLNPGGWFTQWLPLYQLTREEFEIVAATFQEVFPDALLFRGDFYAQHPIVALVGSRDGRLEGPATMAAARRLAGRGVEDRWVTHPLGPWALYAGPLAAIASDWQEVPRNTVDRPVLEFLAPRHHAGGASGVSRPFVGLAFASFAKDVREQADQAGPEPVRELSAAARRAALGGHALQVAGALFHAGRGELAGQALADAAADLPEALLARAPEDPSAADVWIGPSQEETN